MSKAAVVMNDLNQLITRITEMPPADSADEALRRLRVFGDLKDALDVFQVRLIVELARRALSEDRDG